MPKFTAKDAAALDRRALILMRAGELTKSQCQILRTMLWSCGGSSGKTTVSYSRLQTLARVSRATVAKAIARFEDLKLIAKLKKRTRVFWANGGQALRQAVSTYFFRATESPTH